MKLKFSFALILTLVIVVALTSGYRSDPVRIMVITGGHDYDKKAFTEMLTGFGNGMTFEIVELPDAFNVFLPENRKNYDVLVFYHMWQTIGEEQKKVFADCIRQGKPLVVLHHSICAFDGWEEYVRIIGGKYFHQSTTVAGREYPASSYIHDRNIPIQVVDTLHPVTKGLRDFVLFDETYMNFYVSPDVVPLLLTSDPTSTPVIGWTHRYGSSTVVTIQSGHDAPTFANENYRRLLRQAIMWVYPEAD
ncbi:MAG TPA: ThuA domain-containing protein [Bacteroidales bacterium]|nr:ThuA domain-containing protein [Bacteroidales bacterium]